MLIIKSLKPLKALLAKIRKAKKLIGFVPTMGSFHEGHLVLIRKAKHECDFVVVSIFVNPIQFSTKEDYKEYPRDLKKDAYLCKKAGVDVIFSPRPLTMYPLGYKTYVNVEGLSDSLCGKFRAGHFRAVATVVNKLFNIVQPDLAYFGQKDAQQAIIIKKMASDLNMPIKIEVLPTVREKDGLAMSSRNIFLRKDERIGALVLNQALNCAKKLIISGNRNPANIINQMKKIINKNRMGKIQYISVVDSKTLEDIDKIKGEVLIALAVLFGKTRLIDNMIINC